MDIIGLTLAAYPFVLGPAIAPGVPGLPGDTWTEPSRGLFFQEASRSLTFLEPARYAFFREDNR